LNKQLYEIKNTVRILMKDDDGGRSKQRKCMKNKTDLDNS